MSTETRGVSQRQPLTRRQSMSNDTHDLCPHKPLHKTSTHVNCHKRRHPTATDTQHVNPRPLVNKTLFQLKCKTSVHLSSYTKRYLLSTATYQSSTSTATCQSSTSTAAKDVSSRQRQGTSTLKPNLSVYNVDNYTNLKVKSDLVCSGLQNLKQLSGRNYSPFKRTPYLPTDKSQPLLHQIRVKEWGKNQSSFKSFERQTLSRFLKFNPAENNLLSKNSSHTFKHKQISFPTAPRVGQKLIFFDSRNASRKTPLS